MDTLLTIIGTGITTLLSSLTPRSWFARVNHQGAEASEDDMASLEERLRQSELRNQQLEARIAELEAQLRTK